MIQQAMLLSLLAALLTSGEVTAAAPATVAGYRLFPGDLVHIEVFGHPDLLVEARVPSDGGITFPLIGLLARPAGRTVDTLSAEITTRLADGFIRDPSVTVQVREYGQRNAWVVGAVRTPGSVRLDPLRPTTALQAIGTAGGFNEDADRQASQVVRDDQANPGRTLSFALTADSGANLQLQHGDVIVVPRADRIFVLGEVQAPQAIPVPSREILTVSKSISLAGGFARFAKESRVQLVRPGQPAVTVDVRAVLDGNAGVADPQVHAGDTVFVPESRF